MGSQRHDAASQQAGGSPGGQGARARRAHQRKHRGEGLPVGAPYLPGNRGPGSRAHDRDSNIPAEAGQAEREHAAESHQVCEQAGGVRQAAAAG